MQHYKQAPLPFQGQKRRFSKQFKTSLKSFQKVDLVVDLFGGSGLLAHTAKEALPHARVIYNDYDNYNHRLENIGKTNKLLADIRNICKDLPRGQLLPQLVKEAVLKRIKQEQGYVDYITLSSSLLFSMKYACSYEALAKERLYAKVRLSDYDLAEDYLQGVEVVCEDYRKLFERYHHCSNVVFVIDPPYLSTDVTTYSNYWKLANYLDVLNCLRDTSYFYFTSNKSSIIEFCEWIEKNLGAQNPFSGATLATTDNQLSYNAGYTDMMLYKQHSPQ